MTDKSKYFLSSAFYFRDSCSTTKPHLMQWLVFLHLTFWTAGKWEPIWQDSSGDADPYAPMSRLDEREKTWQHTQGYTKIHITLLYSDTDWTKHFLFALFIHIGDGRFHGLARFSVGSGLHTLEPYCHIAPVTPGGELEPPLHQLTQVASHWVIFDGLIYTISLANVMNF